ncbi:unnamed protein product [Gongylonema pulchrum]|uniref:SHSP domain-containing protein n=1 Tax=Gongylonema pulchrum TaxID=637853 RepID=A0A183E6U1_9BILA|nr:unnamed protein product [Gongylonema pulchrum]
MERQFAHAIRRMDRMLGPASDEWPVVNENIQKQKLTSDLLSKFRRLTASRSFQVTDEKGRFAVKLNVSAFHPEELAVKIQDREVCIEGHHEERSDQHGSVERHFVQKFLLHTTALPDSVESSLSDDGVLRVTAQKKCTVEEVQSRRIPIQPVNN